MSSLATPIVLSSPAIVGCIKPRLKVKAEYSYSWESISELIRGVTCRMGSNSVTSHPTQVNAPRHNPSQPGRYSIYLLRRDGRLSWLNSLTAARPGIEPTTAWSQVRRLTVTPTSPLAFSRHPAAAGQRTGMEGTPSAASLHSQKQNPVCLWISGHVLLMCSFLVMENCCWLRHL